MSGTDSSQLIQIKATGKRNGLTVMIVGVLVLLLAMGLLAWLPKSLSLAGILALSASLVIILLGWFKLREPEHSVELSREAIHYRHRHGQWQLSWHNIQRIDTPRVQKGLDVASLGLVGIRIKDYAPLLASISPRLATNLLMEQRPLLFQGDNCQTGTCYSESLIENDKYRLADGTVLTGVKAMMANRMARLRERLGYDLFIAASELDREADEFVNLLRQCQIQVLSSPTP